jgi:hypothetical protein
MLITGLAGVKQDDAVVADGREQGEGKGFKQKTMSSSTLASRMAGGFL